MRNSTGIHELKLFLFSIFIIYITTQHIAIVAADLDLADDSQSQYNWDHNHHQTSVVSGSRILNPTLIIQSLPPGPEEELLDITSRVNRAYAKRWGFDYLSYVGSDTDSFLLRMFIHKEEGDGGNDVALVEAEINGVKDGQVVSDATNQNHADTGAVIRNANINLSPSPTVSEDNAKQKITNYGSIMFLQSDALIVELDYNILDLIQEDSLVASGVTKTNGVWNVYSNVMLWNLKHPLFDNVTDSWLELDLDVDVDGKDTATSQRQRMRGPTDGNVNVESNLARILMEMEERGMDGGRVVDTIPKELVNGLDGTVIKQCDEDSKQDLQNDLPRIIPLIQGISDNVCYRYYPQCELVYF